MWIAIFCCLIIIASIDKNPWGFWLFSYRLIILDTYLKYRLEITPIKSIISWEPWIATWSMYVTLGTRWRILCRFFHNVSPINAGMIHSRGSDFCLLLKRIPQFFSMTNLIKNVQISKKCASRLLKDTININPQSFAYVQQVVTKVDISVIMKLPNLGWMKLDARMLLLFFFGNFPNNSAWSLG